MLGTAGLALQPRLFLAPHIACQEIAARLIALAMRRSERRDVAPGAGVRIFPRDTEISAAARKHVRHLSACINKIAFRHWPAGVRIGGRLAGMTDRAGLFHVGVVFWQN